MGKPDWYNEYLDFEESRANSWLCDNPIPEEGKMKHQLSYFAEDGNYGTCEVVLLLTEHWTNADWEEVREASDRERIEVAMRINETREPKKEKAQ
jgi:hypothetical protein